MPDDLLQTPLHAWHAAHGGRMVDFAGWSMPVQYTSIVEEHQTCRTSTALFDVSHMGRLFFEGPAAEKLLDRLLTRKVAGLPPGKIRYSLMCNEAGGILDDVLIYHVIGLVGPPYFLLVVNASNRTKILTWIKQQSLDGVQLTDRTTQTAMIAVQGPQALERVSPHAGFRLADLTYYSSIGVLFDGTPAVISRTGYTGEDGCEIIVEAPHAERIWGLLIKEGAGPAGLAARDTLRLEAAMPLYGHELNESISPYQARLDFAVNLKDRDFVGRAALERLKSDPSQPKRVGLSMTGRRVPREHYGVFAESEQVGEVTSGTFSPTLNKPIAMAYVQPRFAEVGTRLSIDIRGSREPCDVVPLPFYSRSREPSGA
jgi:aminomethyltransferase